MTIIAINTLALCKTKTGMGNYIVELVERLPTKDNKNFYVVYMSQHNKQFFTIDALQAKKNVKIVTVPCIFTHPYAKTFWEQCILPFQLIKENVAIYHGLGFTLPFLKNKNITYVVTIADMTFYLYPEFHKSMYSAYFQYMIRQAVKNADVIITISKNTKEDILKLFPKTKQRVVAILLGVDDAFYHKKDKQDQQKLEKYNIKYPYILYVGMLEPRKNVPGLIAAFAGIKNKKKHKLVIVGKKGWKYDQIFTEVKKYNLNEEIIFTGYVPDHDLPTLYRNATCFVYPSFYEGFGIPVLEAMACGCPVITSRNSSLIEIGGDAALFIDPEKTETIKEAIVKMIYNTQERTGRINKGILQAKKCTWDKMVEETILVYNKYARNE